MEEPLTVREADRMLSELAGGGHLSVEIAEKATLFSSVETGADKLDEARLRNLTDVIHPPGLPRGLSVRASVARVHRTSSSGTMHSVLWSARGNDREGGDEGLQREQSRGA